MGRIQAEEIQEPPRFKSVSQWIWAITAIVGVGLLFSGALRAQRMLACSSWPTVEGAIITSEMKRGFIREGSLKYNYRIVYRYSVDGTAYENDRISFSGSVRANNQGQSIFRTYPKAKKVTVHHHPTDPDLSVLETARAWSGFKMLLLGILLAPLAVAGFWRRWPLQTDYLFRERNPDAPLTRTQFILGTLGFLTCLGIAWIWWELIKQYAGR